MTFETLRIKDNKEKQWNIGTASQEELFSSNIGVYSNTITGN